MVHFNDKEMKGFKLGGDEEEDDNNNSMDNFEEDLENSQDIRKK
eukprot:CAMPEP_0204821246 /NCGR_PEP_ID=MMETSP1018-20131115/6076_1 /ASSEMBLY_ACC=CAM_ASM_000518 /TAXON_ID=46462 /ORGANISM="Anophryoides haemophila, Strain AH6" /LENGTH=43 /DNA_ID= /DNA_START= /DNA_END= /DNA_ORIENTATION=